MAGIYPDIPEKYRDAVMMACRIIRETHYYNVALREASEAYGVDIDELKKHVDARAAAGHRAQGYKRENALKYYVIDETRFEKVGGKTERATNTFILKGYDESAVREWLNADEKERSEEETRESGNKVYYSFVVVNTYSAKKKAESAAKQHVACVKDQTKYPEPMEQWFAFAEYKTHDTGEKGKQLCHACITRATGIDDFYSKWGEYAASKTAREQNGKYNYEIIGIYNTKEAARYAADSFYRKGGTDGCTTY